MPLTDSNNERADTVEVLDLAAGPKGFTGSMNADVHVASQRALITR